MMYQFVHIYVRHFRTVVSTSVGFIQTGCQHFELYLKNWCFIDRKMKGTLIYYYTSYNPYYGILMEKNGQNSGSERLKKCTVPVVFLHYLLSKKSTHRLHLFSWSRSSKSEVLDFKVWNKKNDKSKLSHFWKK